jgi:hypothetical protein
MTGKDSNGKSDFPWIKNNKPLGSSCDIYSIQEASIRANDPNSLLDVIDERDYDLKNSSYSSQLNGDGTFKNKINKIEWICNNFKVTTKELKEKK